MELKEKGIETDTSKVSVTKLTEPQLFFITNRNIFNLHIKMLSRCISGRIKNVVIFIALSVFVFLDL